MRNSPSVSRGRLAHTGASRPVSAALEQPTLRRRIVLHQRHRLPKTPADDVEIDAVTQRPVDRRDLRQAWFGSIQRSDASWASFT